MNRSGRWYIGLCSLRSETKFSRQITSKNHDISAIQTLYSFLWLIRHTFSNRSVGSSLVVLVVLSVTQKCYTDKMTTMLITALLTVTVFVSSSYCRVYPCCLVPTEPVDQLDAAQLLRITSEISVIQEIERDPQLLYNASYQRSFVTLTTQQNRQHMQWCPPDSIAYAMMSSG